MNDYDYENDPTIGENSNDNLHNVLDDRNLKRRRQ